MKVYCRNCKHFPRLRLFGRKLAVCKEKNAKDDWYHLRWVHLLCYDKNFFNNCPDYETKEKYK